MANRYMKRCSASFILREMWIRTIGRCFGLNCILKHHFILTGRESHCCSLPLLIYKPLFCCWSKLNIQKMKIVASGPITSWEIDWETMETVIDFILGAPKSLQMVTAAMKLKNACSLEESYDQPRPHIKKQRHYFANKGPSSQSYGFSGSYVWMWELDHKEKLSTKKLMLLNCGVREDSWESLGLQGDPTSPS